MTQPSPKHREEARELLPCPFCGAVPPVGVDLGHFQHNRPCYVIAWDKQEKIDGWQRRGFSTRDQEIREVLEGFPWRKDNNGMCWCSKNLLLDIEPHSPACLAARALYEKVQVVKEGNDGDN